MNNITELIKEAHDNAVERGFYDCPECKGNGYSGGIKIEDAGIGDQCGYCNGSGIDPNKNIGELLMLIVSELGEALEAHRNNRFADKFNFDNTIKNLEIGLDIAWFETRIKDTFEDEIADVFIRLFDLYGYLGYEQSKIYDNWSTQKEWTDNTGDNLRKICKIILDVNPGYIGPSYFSSCLSYLNFFCKYYDISIEKHIKAKMAYNRTREHKHGKEY